MAPAHLLGGDAHMAAWEKLLGKEEMKSYAKLPFVCRPLPAASRPVIAGLAVGPPHHPSDAGRASENSTAPRSSCDMGPWREDLQVVRGLALGTAATSWLETRPCPVHVVWSRQ